MFGKKINFLVKLISSFVLFGLLCLSIQGQENIQFSQGKVEEGMSNSMSVPLMNYKGRGIDLPITLNYSSNVWRIDNLNTIYNSEYIARQTITQAIYSEYATSGWRNSLDLPKIEFPKSTDTYYSSGGAYCYICGSGAPYRIDRVFVHLPDGSIHELRKSDTAHTGAIEMSGTFYAVDGSRLRYDGTDEDTGTLYLPDGTRYILDAGSAQLIDRNGNTLNYNGTTRQ